MLGHMDKNKFPALVMPGDQNKELLGYGVSLPSIIVDKGGLLAGVTAFILRRIFKLFSKFFSFLVGKPRLKTEEKKSLVLTETFLLRLFTEHTQVKYILYIYIRDGLSVLSNQFPSRRKERRGQFIFYLVLMQLLITTALICCDSTSRHVKRYFLRKRTLLHFSVLS